MQTVSGVDAAPTDGGFDESANELGWTSDGIAGPTLQPRRANGAGGGSEVQQQRLVAAERSGFSNGPVGLLFIGVGFTAFLSGLGTPFKGDTVNQILQSPPTHSIGNIVSFFSSGTFWDGNSLVGVYYRPMLLTVYSLLYTIFGAEPFYFHALQLILCVSSALLLYQVFKRFFGDRLALTLALVFLVHPANSQVAFAISEMDGTLFFFFGILAIWLAQRYQSFGSRVLVVACLACSMLSKETGVLFVAMVLTYLVWWERDRRRLVTFIGLITPVIGAYLLLKVNATGLDVNPHNAPISFVDLGGRLLNIPSLGLFYLTKMVWPWPLATEYYWVHSTFSIEYFVLPFVIDLAALAGVVSAGVVVARCGSRAQRNAFWFFASWAALGLLAHLQIIALDRTATVTWLYLPLAGVLGMVGVFIAAVAPLRRVDGRLVVVGSCVLIVVMGLATGIRGTEYSSAYVMAQHNLAEDPDNFTSAVTIASQLMSYGDYAGAQTFAEQAVRAFPGNVTYNTLAVILMVRGQYQQAKDVLLADAALPYQVLPGEGQLISENLGLLTRYFGDPQANKAFLVDAVAHYPQDGKLWLDLAILEQNMNDNADAKEAVTKAWTLGAVSDAGYSLIMNNQALPPPAPIAA